MVRVSASSLQSFALASGHPAPRRGFVFLNRRCLTLRIGDHSGGNGSVCFRIDQDQRAGSAIVAIEIDRHWAQQMQRNSADVVHAQRHRRLMPERGKIHAVID